MILGKLMIPDTTPSRSPLILAVDAGVQPYVRRSSDLGSSWNTVRVTALGYGNGRGMRIGYTNRYAFFVGNANTAESYAFWTQDEGASFTATSETATYIYGHSISKSGLVMLSCRTHDSEYVYRSTNGGSNWSALSSPSYNKPYGAVVDDTGNYIALSNNDISNVLRKTTNGGTSWSNSAVPFGAGVYIPSICMSSDMNYLYAGSTGTTYPTGKLHLV